MLIFICSSAMAGPSDRGAKGAVEPVPKGEGDGDGSSR